MPTLLRELIPSWLNQTSDGLGLYTCEEKSCFHRNLSAMPSELTTANSAGLGRRFLWSSMSYALTEWEFSAGSYGGFAMNQHVGMASSPPGKCHTSVI